jgi:hypothetical protein
MAGACGAAEEPWIVQSSADWTQTQADARHVAVGDKGIALKGANDGHWTSKWHKWNSAVDGAKIAVTANLDQFANKTVKVVLKGSQKPYTDASGVQHTASGVQHTWYGRCMLAIVDRSRWIMSLRSGVNHIAWRSLTTVPSNRRPAAVWPNRKTTAEATRS